MDNLFRSLQKSIILDVRAWVLALQLLPYAPLVAKESTQPAKNETKMVSSPSDKKSETDPGKLVGLLDQASQSPETYTINFNNISIVEYIRFISRITGINFVFNESELGFSITVVSEEPLAVAGVISALIQTLRAHNMHLIEQNGNVIVTRNTLVNQIPTVVSVEVPAPSDIGRHPLVTRVFRIRNAKPATLATLIKPLCSAAAVIESSQETNQLIVTDIPANVDQISDLLSSLDIPHTPFEIEIYTTKVLQPQKLIELVNKILTPLSQGNSLHFVPQTEMGKIYIISTPNLIERALALFEDLDVHPEVKTGSLTSAFRELFLYKIKHQSSEILIKGLKEVARRLEESNPIPVHTIHAIDQVRWIPESNSLLFNTDPDTINKIEKILANLDVIVEGQQKMQQAFALIPIHYADGEKLLEQVKEFGKELAKTGSASIELTHCLETLRFIKENNTILVASSGLIVDEVKKIIAQFDTPQNTSMAKHASTFEIYKVKYVEGEKLLRTLEIFANDLRKTQGDHSDLLMSIKDIRYVKENNTLILSGTPATLMQIKSILMEYDNPERAEKEGRETFEIYSPKFLSAKKLKESLSHFAKDLAKTKGAPPILLTALEEVRYVEENNTLILTGSPHIITEMKQVIALLDTAKASSENLESHVEMVPILHVEGEDLIKKLHEFANELKKTKGASKEVIDTLEGARFVEESNSLLLDGTTGSIAEAKIIIGRFDSLGARGALSHKEAAVIELIPLTNAPGDRVLEEVKDFAKELAKTKGASKSLIESLETLHYVPPSRSIIASGKPSEMARIKEIIHSFDVVKPADKNFVLYALKFSDGQKMIERLEEFADQIEKTPGATPELLQTLRSVRYVEESNQLVISGAKTDIDRTYAIIEQFDVHNQGMPKGPEVFAIYTLKKVDGGVILQQLEDFRQKLSKSKDVSPSLLETIKKVNWIKENNTMLIIGPQESVDQVKKIIEQFDETLLPMKAPRGAEIFVLYPLHYAHGKDLIEQLDDFAERMKSSPGFSPELYDALRRVQLVEENNNLVITGSVEIVNQIKGIISQFDVPTAQIQPMETEVFVLFQLRNHDWPTMEKRIQDFTSNLENSKTAYPPLVKTLKSLRFLRENNSILITGPQPQVDQVQQLLTQFDQVDAKETALQRKQLQETYVLYKLKYTSGKQLLSSLKKLSSDLSDDDPMKKELIQSVNKAKFIAENNSVMFQGKPDVIEQLVTLAEKFDLPGMGEESFEIIELKHARGNMILKQLDSLANKLDATPAPNMQLLRGLRSVQWVEETNTLLVTGSPEVVAQIKTLVSKYDILSPEELALQKGDKGTFYVYRPIHKSGRELRSQLIAFKDNLKSSGLEDVSLIRAIEKVQYVPSTDSLVITASSANIEKIKDILSKLDQPSKTAPQQPENLTFFMYKAQYGTLDQIGNMLRGVAVDLEKSRISDPNLLSAIRNMKKIRESNSILFTGTPDSLKKIEELLAKFDTPDLARNIGQLPISQIERPSANEFMLYRPQYQSGTELIATLHDFRSNLAETGVVDKNLFDTIDNLKYIEKTGSILVSGTSAAITRVEELLKRFDFPEEGVETPKVNEADETNFLVYKLQYHQGEDLVNSLKALGKKFESHPNEGTRLMSQAISSIQWIEITNSLLASGEPDVLKRLRYLIQNLDIPLKQVLVEVLVIQTSVENSTSFGVDWAAGFQYKNKFAQSITNNASATGLENAVTSLNPIASSPTYPTVAGIPQNDGAFNFGVIGDIIMHKGKSFLTMGALINALQSDAETAIVTNPKIICQDNRTSSIFNGSSIPFVGSVVNNAQGNQTVVTSSIEYRDIGFNLTITPVIGVNNMVTLEINNSISSTVGPTDVTTQEVNGITSTSNTMTTKVSVPNEHFVIISGIISDTKNQTRSSIPCLGGLPMVGAAFRNINRVGSNAGFVIFLRPVVLDSPDDFYKVTDYEKDLWKDQIGLPTLQEQFDEVIDRIDIDKVK